MRRPCTHSSGHSTLPLYHSWGQGLLVQGTVFQPFDSSSGSLFIRVFSLVSELANQGGICLLRYLGDWLLISEPVPFLLQHLEQLLQLCQDLGIVIIWEKSDSEPSSMAQCLGMLIDTIRESVFSMDSQIVRFWDLSDEFRRCGSSF